MMRNYWLLVLLLLIGLQLHGQQNKLIRRDTIAVPFSVGFDQSSPSINADIDRALHSGSLVHLLSVEKFSLRDGDLTFQYDLLPIREDWEYKMNFRVIAQNGEAVDFRQFQYPNALAPLPNQDGGFRYDWVDVTEQQLISGREYALQVSSELLGSGLQCGVEPIPEFNRKAFYQLGILGVGLVGAGIGLRESAASLHRRYQSDWIAGEPTSSIEGFATRRDLARLALYSGLAVLAFDGIRAYLQRKKDRKALREYRTFCGPRNY